MVDRSIHVLGGLDYGPAPEASDDVRAWIKNHDGGYFSHFINGEFIRFSSGEMLPVYDPATGEKIAWISQGRAEDVEAAMKAAYDADLVWGGHPDSKRAEYLYAIARRIAARSKEFARLESLNNGKTIRETRDLDVPLAIRHFYNCAGWAANRDKEFPNHCPGGVVAQIIPWNFPFLMLAWKVAPALAAGNAIVLKPAEFTPLTAMLFAEILRDEVKLPPGVVNIVNGGPETGKLIATHPKPWKIAFTGSTEVGRWIRRETAGSEKQLSLELGGKSPFIIFEDADIDSAVEGVVDAIWFNYGQVCCAGSRLLVQESVYERVIRKLKARMSKFRGGAPLDKAMDFGAVNSKIHKEKIESLVAHGKDKEGLDIWQPKEWNCPAKGYHFPPTLVTGVSPSSRLAQEEIFGPVLVCMSFRTPNEAIELANNTAYGLAASIWTESVGKAFHAARRIKAGTIWNNCTNLFDAAAGFGGYRESGYGREGGREGIEEYLVERLPISSGTREDVELAPIVGGIDRTYRLFIGGELVRPDEGQSFKVHNARGELLGLVGNANRKDVRNAVAAARKIQADWEYKASPHLRAQLLYFLAENLKASQAKFLSAYSMGAAQKELDYAVKRLFEWAGMADKFGGEIQEVSGQINCQAINEPVGVIGIRAPDNSPLLGLTTAIGSGICRGNSMVVIAGNRPMQALELMQVIENSDLKKWPGVVNILTAKDPDARAKELAEHLGVDAVWCWSSPEVCAEVERASAGNMKRVWTVSKPEFFDWYGPAGKSKKFLREATQVKNIWTPYGV